MGKKKETFACDVKERREDADGRTEWLVNFQEWGQARSIVMYKQGDVGLSSVISSGQESHAQCLRDALATAPDQHRQQSRDVLQQPAVSNLPPNATRDWRIQ